MIQINSMVVGVLVVTKICIISSRPRNIGRRSGSSVRDDLVIDPFLGIGLYNLGIDFRIGFLVVDVVVGGGGCGCGGITVVVIIIIIGIRVVNGGGIVGRFVFDGLNFWDGGT